MSKGNKVKGQSSQLPIPTVVKKVCVVHVRACCGGGVLVWVLPVLLQLFFLVGNLANHVCSPFLLSECTAGLFVNLLLTEVDLWEWCCTRRGFSLSSMRFSTFFCPRRSLGGHVLHLLKDTRGGEALYVVKPDGYLNHLSNHVCMWWLVARVSDCRFKFV